MTSASIVRLTPPALGARSAAGARPGSRRAAGSAGRRRPRRSAWRGARRAAGSVQGRMGRGWTAASTGRRKTRTRSNQLRFGCL